MMLDLLPRTELISDIHSLLFPILEELGSTKSIANLNSFTKDKWKTLERQHRYRGDIAIPVGAKYCSKNSRNSYMVTGATVMDSSFSTLPVLLFFQGDNLVSFRLAGFLSRLDFSTVACSNLKQEVYAAQPAIVGSADLEYFFDTLPELYEYIDEEGSSYELKLGGSTYYTIIALTEYEYLAVNENDTNSNSRIIYHVDIKNETSQQVFPNEASLLSHVKSNAGYIELKKS